MDHDITEKEVIDASRELQNNKASAQDLIKNEMIKTVNKRIGYNINIMQQSAC